MVGVNQIFSQLSTVRCTMKALQTLIIILVVALLAGIITGLVMFIRSSNRDKIETYKFPVGFKFGGASASYQIEGGWDLDGKTENIWDHLVHTQPDLITDKLNADVGADSYHFYKDDVAALKNAGVIFQSLIAV